ncbi:hypothetical protein [Cryobacterium roopkundense]|uniref:Anthranilate phosphoribosyltransferase n=1 Tax=Cryobacterium roopkundense TaxID=1001240 RepID=A0A7W8ZYT4_9MICO|nr:hypothetical protein [Cryobacterium roopkundense]MBB5642455.1 anthranilate phosphoribosyltransferase [Cryobacterium roopkundense]
MSTVPGVLDLLGLLAENAPVPVTAWAAFWQRVADNASDPAEFVDVLTALSRELPRDETLVSFVTSISGPAPERLIEAVNIVGIGGGPPTMNLSTAAALVAAASGVPVVKGGSRAYTSSLGSTELIGRAGIPTTTSLADLQGSLAATGIAFAGQHVYPTEFTRLARRIVPVGMKEFGAFLNVIGPFAARIPVRALVTGRSSRASTATLRALGSADPTRSLWICSSEFGADELLSICRSTILAPDGQAHVIVPGTLTSGRGSLHDLAPADPDDAVEHFAQALAGTLAVAVTETLCLNAAVVILASGAEHDLSSAYARATASVASGAASRLLGALHSPVTVQPAGARV